jgi:hypothetical protein
VLDKDKDKDKESAKGQMRLYPFEIMASLRDKLKPSAVYFGAFQVLFDEEYAANMGLSLKFQSASKIKCNNSSALLIVENFMVFFRIFDKYSVLMKSFSLAMKSEQRSSASAKALTLALASSEESQMIMERSAILRECVALEERLASALSDSSEKPTFIHIFIHIYVYLFIIISPQTVEYIDTCIFIYIYP